MKKIVVSLIIFILFVFTTSDVFSIFKEYKVKGRKYTCSDSRGPWICCDPQYDEECIICYSEFSFEQQPYQEHVGLFIPDSQDPNIGEGFTDVNVRKITLSGGGTKYEYVINPENQMINNYLMWKQFMENKNK